LKNFNDNLNLKQNYFRLGLFANSLILNKKMYLLYNFFNKKKEFFLLKNKNKENNFDRNYLSLFSLKFKFFIKNSIICDYFYK